MYNIIVIEYLEAGIKYTTILEGVTIESFNPDIHLIDFYYFKNDDGDYILTGWKETYNGEPSTECIIPANSLIHV